MWNISKGPAQVRPLKDHRRFRFVIERGDERRDVFVEISGTAAASDPEALSGVVADAVRSNGRDAVQRYIDEANRDGTEPPSVLEVSTDRIWPHIAPTIDR